LAALFAGVFLLGCFCWGVFAGVFLSKATLVDGLPSIAWLRPVFLSLIGVPASFF
jgi:hypothetical protein